MPRLQVRQRAVLSALVALITAMVSALVFTGRDAYGDTLVIQDTNQGTGLGQVQFSANWNLCTTTCGKAADNSYRWTSTVGASVTVRFSGTGIRLFGVKEPWSNIATVSIDGGSPVDVDFYANPATAAVVEVYASPTLADTTHTLVLTMTSRRNPSSGGGSAITFDRAEITTGTPPTSPPPTPPVPAPALSGAGVENPYSFGAWRGTPVQIWETWNNFGSWSQMEAIPTVHQYFTGEGTAPFNVRFPGAMSFSQPMWAAGENANTCNSGVNDGHMRAIFTNLNNVWGDNVWVRLGWEMNGYWFPQNYAPPNPTGWVNCWRRWHGIIKSVSPNFKLVWNPNWNSNTNGQGGFDVRTVWPGDQYVDAAGPDYYDFNINPLGFGFGGEPQGITRWREFVASHNKPFAVPEWGLNTPNGGVDDVAFIQQMHDAFQAAANSPSGLAYQSYFNLLDCTFKITDGCNPNAGARYQQLF